MPESILTEPEIRTLRSMPTEQRDALLYLLYMDTLITSFGKGNNRDCHQAVRRCVILKFPSSLVNQIKKLTSLTSTKGHYLETYLEASSFITQLEGVDFSSERLKQLNIIKALPIPKSDEGALLLFDPKLHDIGKAIYTILKNPDILDIDGLSDTDTEKLKKNLKRFGLANSNSAFRKRIDFMIEHIESLKYPQATTSSMLVAEQADLDQLPLQRIDGRDLAEHEVTVGDLHGNALKLLHFLIREGVLEFRSQPQEKYAEFVSIYKASNELTNEDFTRAQALINQLKANKVKLVRLIGDELYDRGQNDILTLLLFDKLKKLDVPVEIMLSNHSLDYLLLLEGRSGYKKCSIHPEQCKSASHAAKFLMPNESDTTEKQKAKETISRINNSVYKPSLKLISYTSQFSDPPQISFFTHAPIGLKTIESLADLFGVDFCDDTAPQLIETVDRINAAFQTALQENKLQDYYKKWPRSHANYDLTYIGPEFPLFAITWNRKHSTLHDQYRSRHPKKYTINWVHGHLGMTKAPVNYRTQDGANSTNLDRSYFAKAPYLNKTGRKNGLYLSLKEKNSGFSFELDQIIKEIKNLHKNDKTTLSALALSVCKSAKKAAKTFNLNEYNEATSTLTVIKNILKPNADPALIPFNQIANTVIKFQAKNNPKKKRFAAKLGIFAGGVLLLTGLALTLTGAGALAGIPMKMAAIKIIGACVTKYSAASVSHGALLNSSGKVIASATTLELAGASYLTSSTVIGGAALFFKKRYALTKKSKNYDSFSSKLFYFHNKAKASETLQAPVEECTVVFNGQDKPCKFQKLD